MYTYVLGTATLNFENIRSGTNGRIFVDTNVCTEALYRCLWRGTRSEGIKADRGVISGHFGFLLGSLKKQKIKFKSFKESQSFFYLSDCKTKMQRAKKGKLSQRPVEYLDPV